MLSKGTTGCKGLNMRKGEKKRKSIRGCIVSPEIRTLNLVIVKQNSNKSSHRLIDDKRSHPRRSSKLRKVFSVSKDDDIRKYIVKEKKNKNLEGKKIKKIQRLVTPELIQRKRRLRNDKNRRYKIAKEKINQFSNVVNGIVY